MAVERHLLLFIFRAWKPLHYTKGELHGNKLNYGAILVNFVEGSSYLMTKGIDLTFTTHTYYCTYYNGSIVRNYY